MPRFGFAWTPTESRRIVVRGGYGMFYERTTGSFANSLRQAPPFFRELQLNDLGSWNIYPLDHPALPLPAVRVGFSSGEPQLEATDAPGVEFEAFETQMVSPDLETPLIQQWSVGVQWEFKRDWLLELGYIGTKGSHLLQFVEHADVPESRRGHQQPRLRQDHENPSGTPRDSARRQAAVLRGSAGLTGGPGACGTSADGGMLPAMRLTVLIAAVATLSPGTAAAAPPRPNVVILYADDLGYGDVSSYGGTALKTPNIDRTAREGLRFTDGHSPAATCTPSRYALLTGEYAFRRPGTGVLPGDAALIIEPGRTTLPLVFQRAGYATGVVGKWHLGLGSAGGPDWNGVIAPGPREIGFASSFIMPATGDRVPTVYVEDGRVVGLDPADPIRVSYGGPVGDGPTGKANPELLKLHPSHGHDQTIVNGISRIGHMSGGKAALWKDEDMADVFTSRAVRFLEQNRSWPFFLFFSAHDPHVPRVPHPRFAGATGLGPRGDAIAQVDWCFGEILKTLDRLALSDDTLVLITSDNGPVLDDGYQDEAVSRWGAHKPAGPLRGGKYSAFEGGTRVPFIVRWPGRVKPGVSSALVSQVDFVASFGTLLGQRLAPADAPDSEDVMPALLGASEVGRATLVEQAGGLALREGSWKYIEPNDRPALQKNTNTELGNAPVPQLYDLASDLGETRNLAPAQPDRVERMRGLLQQIRARERPKPLSTAVALSQPPPARKGASPQGKGRPNVLLIAVDDLNHWVGHLGRNTQVVTPNIDRLAARGVTFANAYCAAPACNPSRAALLSGLRPSTTGVYHNETDWRPAIPREKTLITHFRANGYYTAGVGKIYHGGFDRRQEWDDYGPERGAECNLLNPTDGVGSIKFSPVDCDDQGLSDHSIASYGIDQLQRRHEKPFLLTVGFHKPHMPWNVPKRYFDLYPLDTIELPPYREDDLADLPPAGVRIARGPGSGSPDKPSDQEVMLKSGRWKEAVQAYLAAISYVDMNVGRLLEALDRSAYRDDTIVVFWGDNGFSLGEKHHWRKFALWEEPTRAPLIWVVPGATKAGTVSKRTVDAMSIFPTLAEACGLPVPSHVEGASITTLLADPNAGWERPALTTHGYQNHAVRTERWRYIRYADGGEELYDETHDPYEWTNLAQDKDYDNVKAELATLFPKVNRPDPQRNSAGNPADGARSLRR